MGRGKSVRRRSKKVFNTRKRRSNKYKHSGWKLKRFPEHFKSISYPPWIVKRDDEET